MLTGSSLKSDTGARCLSAHTHELFLGHALLKLAIRGKFILNANQ